MPAATLSDSTSPLFLSSLQCSKGDKSLLDDCSHYQVGLASCDDTSGLAVTRCFGKKIQARHTLKPSYINGSVFP